MERIFRRAECAFFAYMRVSLRQAARGQAAREGFAAGEVSAGYMHGLRIACEWRS